MTQREPGRLDSHLRGMVAVFLRETVRFFEDCDCRAQEKTDSSTAITIHVLHRYWSTQAGLFPAANCGRGPAFFLMDSSPKS